jgi:hypothetical protein
MRLVQSVLSPRRFAMEQQRSVLVDRQRATGVPPWLVRRVNLVGPAVSYLTRPRFSAVAFARSLARGAAPGVTRNSLLSMLAVWFSKASGRGTAGGQCPQAPLKARSRVDMGSGRGSNGQASSARIAHSQSGAVSRSGSGSGSGELSPG